MATRPAGWATRRDGDCERKRSGRGRYWVGRDGHGDSARLGSGSTVLLADVNEVALNTAAADLRAEGYHVVEQLADVSNLDLVGRLAETAATLGRVEVLAHTAGLSPVQASVDAILQVDLLGTAHMLDEFVGVISPGGAAVFIASMAGTMAPRDPDFEHRLATTETAALLDLPEVKAITDQGTAYGLAKRANQVRVRAAAVEWARQQARVNTISPGIISTPMGVAELEGPSGDRMPRHALRQCRETDWHPSRHRRRRRFLDRTAFDLHHRHRPAHRRSMEVLSPLC